MKFRKSVREESIAMHFAKKSKKTQAESNPHTKTFSFLDIDQPSNMFNPNVFPY